MEFNVTAYRVKRKMCWQNVKLWIILLFLLFVILVVLIGKCVTSNDINTVLSYVDIYMMCICICLAYNITVYNYDVIVDVYFQFYPVVVRFHNDLCCCFSCFGFCFETQEITNIVYLIV